MDKSFTVHLDEIDLMGLIPSYFQAVTDFQELMSTEQVELETLKDNIIRVYNNLFIQTCDEDTLREHERLLGIFVQYGDTLEIRRLRIINRYNNSLPVTMRSLKTRLDLLLGAGNWEMSIDYPGYTVYLRVENIVGNLADEALNMLIQLLPANMVVDLGLLYKTYGSLKGRRHCELGKYTHEFLRKGVFE